MGKHFIEHFIWGYQTHFRALIASLSKQSFAYVGADIVPDVFLVAVRRPNRPARFPVCIEPENGKWPLSIFGDLSAEADKRFADHPMQQMFYSDEATMRDKPERIRKLIIRELVDTRLKEFDEANGCASFIGDPIQVDDYYACTVIQVPENTFARYPCVPGAEKFNAEPSLLHCVIRTVLTEASAELSRPDAGRSTTRHMRSAEEISRISASAFLRTPGLMIEEAPCFNDLYGSMNRISALLYEGNVGRGRWFLVDPNHQDLSYIVRFEKPIPIRETRWARKILEMSSDEVAVISNCDSIFGLAKLDIISQGNLEGIFEVEFLAQYIWDLKSGSTTFVRSKLGEPLLPQEPIEKTRFADNCNRLFSDRGGCDADAIWQAYRILMRDAHGAMLVVATDAASEAKRLQSEGIQVAPKPIDDQLIECASRVDGTIIIDPSGKCHAIAVILDGATDANCSASRGSRYNAAVRYVNSQTEVRMAVVLSQDGTLDILPLLRNRMDRNRLECELSAWECASEENFYRPRIFLDENRFYLDEQQCERANRAMERIRRIVLSSGRIWIDTPKFELNPDLNKHDYF